MDIIKYTYRKPRWLQENKIEQLDSIAIHHTGNNNSIDVNTDYHVDNNAWNWLGYNFYITDGKIYEVRGIKYQGAGVANHNNHIISVAVQGNYEHNIPSQDNMEALQYLVSHLKTELPELKHIEGHNKWNETSCPGKSFPVARIKLEGFQENKYATVEDVEKLIKELAKLKESMGNRLERLESKHRRR